MKFRLRRPSPLRRLADRRAGAVLRAFLRDAPHAILIVDPAHRLVTANPAAAALTRAVAPGTRAVELFANADAPSVARLIAAALAGSPGAAPCDLRGLDGAETRVRLAAVPLRDTAGAVVGAALHLTDLTEQHRLEAELAQGQKWQVIGQLAGGIAHDFNNLLAAIRGGAEDLAASDDPAVREEARHILESTERGASLVGQILAFGRQQRLRPRVLAVNDGLRALAPLLRRLLTRRIAVVLNLAEPGRHIHVDPTRFDQVIVNLAVNARDAMPDGGTLTLATAPRLLLEPTAHGADTAPPGRYLALEVTDTGPGIPPEVLPRIFDPFFTTRRDRGGTGLGLATVDGIVRQSGGFIAVETSPTGTAFRLLFPRHDEGATAPPVEPKPDPAPSPPAVACPTVLLVDDEDALRRVAARALARHGCTVIERESGEAALARFAEHPPPDVVVSDVVMPGMDGVALAERLAALCPARIVLVSGYTDAALRARIDRASVGFLEKPYQLDSLVEAVRSAHTLPNRAVAAKARGGRGQ